MGFQSTIMQENTEEPCLGQRRNYTGTSLIVRPDGKAIRDKGYRRLSFSFPAPAFAFAFAVAKP